MNWLRHRNATGSWITSDTSVIPSDCTTPNTKTTGFRSSIPSLLYFLSESSLSPVTILISPVQTLQIFPITHGASPSTLLPFHFLSYTLSTICMPSLLKAIDVYRTHCSHLAPSLPMTPNYTNLSSLFCTIPFLYITRNALIHWLEYFLLPISILGPLIELNAPVILSSFALWIYDSTPTGFILFFSRTQRFDPAVLISSTWISPRAFICESLHGILKLFP